jgi:hypothetical protein
MIPLPTPPTAVTERSREENEFPNNMVNDLIEHQLQNWRVETGIQQMSLMGTKSTPRLGVQCSTLKIGSIWSSQHESREKLT